MPQFPWAADPARGIARQAEEAPPTVGFNATTLILLIVAGAFFWWSMRRRRLLEERLREQRRQETVAHAEESARNVAHIMRAAPPPGAAAAAAAEGLASAARYPAPPPAPSPSPAGGDGDAVTAEATVAVSETPVDNGRAEVIERAEAVALAERAAAEEARRAASAAEAAGESETRRLAAAAAAAEEARSDTADALQARAVEEAATAELDAREALRAGLRELENEVEPPLGAIAGDGTATCPPGFPVKGNAQSKIYHEPGQSSYPQTIAEFCFASAEAAEAAGFRQSRARGQRAQE